MARITLSAVVVEGVACAARRPASTPTGRLSRRRTGSPARLRHRELLGGTGVVVGAVEQVRLADLAGALKQGRQYTATFAVRPGQRRQDFGVAAAVAAQAPGGFAAVRRSG